MAVQDVPNPIVHRVSLNPGNETRKAKTRLDEIFDEREERAAKRFSAAELEKMALESENEAARLRGEPPKYKYYKGEEMDDEERKKKEEDAQKQREKITAQAVALINSGMEPQQVGQMLMGLAPTGASPAVSQGMNFKDVMEMVTFMVGKKEADELKGVIANLDKKIDDMTRNPPRRDESKPIDPVTFARQQAETLRIYHETLDEMGMIPKRGPVGEKGEPLEVIKERNRHEEKMEEVKADRDYKQNITNIASEIPERLGRGMASQFTEEHKENTGSSRLKSIECSDCHTRIKVPLTATQVTCPKCGAIYAQKETVEAE